MLSTVAGDISDKVEIIGPDSAALHTRITYYLHIDYYVSITCLVCKYVFKICF